MISKKTITYLLRISTFFIFIGRAWQYIRWDAPFRTLLWDENLMSSIVSFFGFVSWKEYTTSPDVDQWIEVVTKINGYFFLVCAVICLFIQRRHTLFRYLIYIGILLLFVLFALETKEKYFEIGLFFEHAIQLMTPIFLIWWIYGIDIKKLSFYMKIATALTFICHAIYAMGFLYPILGMYPTPGVFVDLVLKTLPITEPQAVQFLNVAGILDIVVAILIFIPKTEKIALLYMFFWGLLTALDRTYANFYIDFPVQSLSQNLHTTIYRIPHGIIPLIIYYLRFHYKPDDNNSILD